MRILKEIKLEHRCEVKSGDSCVVTIQKELVNTKSDFVYEYKFDKEAVYTHMLIIELDEYSESFGIVFVNKKV